MLARRGPSFSGPTRPSLIREPGRRARCRRLRRLLAQRRVASRDGRTGAWRLGANGGQEEKEGGACRAKQTLAVGSVRSMEGVRDGSRGGFPADVRVREAVWSRRRRDEVEESAWRRRQPAPRAVVEVRRGMYDVHLERMWVGLVSRGTYVCTCIPCRTCADKAACFAETRQLTTKARVTLAALSGADGPRWEVVGTTRRPAASIGLVPLVGLPVASIGLVPLAGLAVAVGCHPRAQVFSTSAL